MWIDLSEGTLTLGEDLIIDGLFSYDQFMKTEYYDGQDPKRVIEINTPFTIGGREFLVELGFRNNLIYSVSLTIADYSIPVEEEEKRKHIHDGFLEEYGISPRSDYEWGSIVSYYDKKGNVSSIEIYYKPG